MLDETIRYYKLTFFQGTRSDEKVFPFKGGLRDAILRGRKHCEVMAYRFGAVRPFIVDLDHQETLKFKDPDWNETLDEKNVGLRDKLEKEQLELNKAKAEAK